MSKPNQMTRNHVFGFILESVTSLEAATTSEIGEYRSAFLNRVSRALDTLCHGVQVTVDMRLISRAGCLQVVLLACASVESSAGTLINTHHEVEFALSAYLPEQSWRTLTTSELEFWLKPFESSSAVLLERAASDPVVDVARADGQAGDPFWLVADLPHGAHDWPLLAATLTAHTSPILLSVRWTPTSASGHELEFATQQATRFAQMLEGAPAWVRDGVTAIGRNVQSWPSRLGSACAMVTITLTSSEPLPASITYVVRQVLAGNAQLLSLVALDEDERQQAIDALGTFASVSAAFSNAPSGLERLPFLCNALELASLGLWVPMLSARSSGLPVQDWREQPLTVQLEPQGGKGIRLGMARSSAGAVPVLIDSETLRRHCYLIGKTGKGKSTLMVNMLLESVRRGSGVFFIDPHGDASEDFLARIPLFRRKDVIHLDFTRPDHGIVLNPLECAHRGERHQRASEVLELFMRQMEDEYQTSVGNFTGPMFSSHVLNNLMLVMSRRTPGTLREFHDLFNMDGSDIQLKYFAHVLGESDLERWLESLSGMDYTKSNDGVPWGMYISTKFTPILFDPRLASVFSQPKSTLNFSQAMNEGKIVVVNLSKGSLGVANARFVGMMIVSMLYFAALERAKLPQAERHDCLIAVDEFQSFASQNFVSLLSEGRKFGVNLVLANQFFEQIKDDRIKGAILGNVGTLISFGVGIEDAQRLEREFHPAFSARDLLNLPNWVACVRTLSKGQVVPGFTLRTDPLPPCEIGFEGRGDSSVQLPKKNSPSTDLSRPQIPSDGNPDSLDIERLAGVPTLLSRIRSLRRGQ
jgi:hypothetical protein